MSESKPDVLFARPLYSYSLDEVAPFCFAHKLWEAENPEAMLDALAPTCRVAVTRAFFSGDWIARLPNLGLVAVCGVGYEGVDMEAARQHEVTVTNTPDVLTEEVADYGVALLLAAARRVVAGDRYVRDGRWPEEGAMAYGQRFYGKNLGILGLGRIGLAVARRCEAFGLQIAYHNRNRREDLSYRYFADPVTLAEWADFFIVITPGGKGTRHLVDGQVIKALGPEGILVNVGRGPTIEDEALASALRSGELGFAALDVFADEPNVPKEFVDLGDKLVLQPHQASATHDTRRAMSELCMDNVRAFLDGDPPLTPVPDAQ